MSRFTTPTKLIPLAVADEPTVTIRVSDLYYYMLRKTDGPTKEIPMPDFANADAEPTQTQARGTRRAAKRGYRKLALTIRVAEYDLLEKMAEEEQRSPDQQAAYLLRQKLRDLEVEAIKLTYREAEERREDAGAPDGQYLDEIEADLEAEEEASKSR